MPSPLKRRATPVLLVEKPELLIAVVFRDPCPRLCDSFLCGSGFSDVVAIPVHAFVLRIPLHLGSLT